MRGALLACALLGCGNPPPSAPSHELVVKPEPPRTLIVPARVVTADIEVSRDHNGVLTVTAHAPKLINDALQSRLRQGLPIGITWRIQIVDIATTQVHAYAAQGCHVAYDVWNEVFSIATLKGVKKSAVNLGGVERLCLHVRDLRMTQTRALIPGARYHVIAIAEIDQTAASFGNLTAYQPTAPLQPSVAAAASRVIKAEFVP